MYADPSKINRELNWTAKYTDVEEALGHAGHRVMAKLYDSDAHRVEVGGPHRLLRAPARPPPRTRSPPPGASCDEGAARRQRAR